MEKCVLCAGETLCPEYIGKGIRTMATNLSILTGRPRAIPKEDGVWLEDGNILSWDNSSGEYASMQCEIHYCPLCGKKLSAKKTKE